MKRIQNNTNIYFSFILEYSIDDWYARRHNEMVTLHIRNLTIDLILLLNSKFDLTH